MHYNIWAVANDDEVIIANDRTWAPVNSRGGGHSDAVLHVSPPRAVATTPEIWTLPELTEARATRFTLVAHLILFKCRTIQHDSWYLYTKSLRICTKNNIDSSDFSTRAKPW